MQLMLILIIDVDCGIVVNSKATQLFDFIKLNIIQKPAYKVKYVSQIKGGLIRNLRVRFFQISWLNYEQYGKKQCKKKEHNQQCSESVKITFILFKCHRSSDNSNYSMHLVVKRLMITKSLVVKI